MNEYRIPTDRVFVVAEAGINHQGDVEIAKRLIDVAADAGCDAVKFQKRTPLMCLPPHLWDVERDTPWGRMKYKEYRERIELSSRDYLQLFAYAVQKDILLFASPWDTNAADTLYHMGMQVFKVASACVTNKKLIEHIAKFQRPVIMSTGMSGYEDIFDAVKILDRYGVPQVALLACTSAYPCKVEDLHLDRISTLKELFPEYLIGYSGHEVGLWTTLCAAAMGAQIVERHITLDRSMVGSDHASSIEPQGLKKLVKEIRNLERAKGSNNLGIRKCEHKDIERLRGINPVTGANLWQEQSPLSKQESDQPVYLENAQS